MSIKTLDRLLRLYWPCGVLWTDVPFSSFQYPPNCIFLKVFISASECAHHRLFKQHFSFHGRENQLPQNPVGDGAGAREGGLGASRLGLGFLLAGFTHQALLTRGVRLQILGLPTHTPRQGCRPDAPPPVVSHGCL